MLEYVAIFLFLLSCYLWSKRENTWISQLPGPVSLPIVGSAFSFACKTEDLLQKMTTILKTYKHPMKFWLGNKLVLVFSDPNHVEKILTSTKLTHKDDLYDFIKPAVGNGLISDSGPNWKHNRRLIQPMFNLKMVKECATVFQNKLDILLQKLDEKADGSLFEVEKEVHRYTVDVIGEIILGYEFNALTSHENDNYLSVFSEFYPLVFDRIIKPWLHPDFIYNLTKYKTKSDFFAKQIQTLGQKCIEISSERRNRNLQSSNESKYETFPIVDMIAEDREKEPYFMSDLDFIHHIFSLYTASEDTISNTVAAACLCLGMYPEYQQKAYDEIKTVTEATGRSITFDDVPKLFYLEMCIKEVMRLVPIAPLIARKTTENFKIDHRVIPAKTTVVISLYDLHRDPKHWGCQDDFYPDNFLPENIKARHPYTFLPFSAGPRGCIGKLLANYGMKLTMANILAKFVIETDGKFRDVKLKTDISVRARNGYYVRLRRR